jgi:low temperature requirement protein LtrA
MKFLDRQLGRQEQTVGWLELFFDLVYVATIIALGNWLSHHFSLEGVAGFVLLFTVVWSSWVGTVLFMNRFNRNDVGQHLLVFLQMYFVVGLAVHMSDPLGELSTGFALSFTLVIAVRILMYLRARGLFQEARPLIKRFILGDVPLLILWLISAFVDPPIRYLLWIGSIIWGISVPLLPQIRQWGERIRPDLRHLSERVSLFTIIVLGEAFSNVVGSSLSKEQHPLSLESVLGLLLVASLWWVYFNLTITTTARENPRARFLWFFSHLPLAIGITAMSVAIKVIVTDSPGTGAMGSPRLMLLGSLAICWLVLAFIEFVTRGYQPLSRSLLAFGRLVSVAVLSGLAIFGKGLSVNWMLLLAALVAVGQVVQDIYWRIRLGDAEDSELTSVSEITGA